MCRFAVGVVRRSNVDDGTNANNDDVTGAEESDPPPPLQLMMYERLGKDWPTFEN